MESNKEPIGFYVLSLGTTLESRGALSELLRDEKRGIASRFKEKGHERLNKSMAKNFLKRVTGFRPHSEGFNRKCIEITLEDLLKGKGTETSYSIYRDWIILSLERDRPELHALLNNHLVHFESESKRSKYKGVDAERVLNEICNGTSSHKVYRPDIELLIELIPELRVSNTEKILDSVAELDRVAKLEREVSEIKKGNVPQSKVSTTDAKALEKLREIEKKLSQHDKALLKRIDGLEESFSSQSDSLKEVFSEQKKQKVDLAGLQTSLSKPVSEELVRSLKNTINDLQGDTARQDELISKAAAQIEEIRSTLNLQSSSILEKQDGLSDRMNHIAESFKLLHSKGLRSGEDSRDSQDLPDPNSTAYVSPFSIESVEAASEPLRRDDSASFEQSFVQILRRLNEAEIALSDIDARIVHSLLLAFPVTFSTIDRIFRSWIGGMGWTDKLHTKFVSPLWVEPSCWFSEQVLLSAPSKSACGVLLNDFEDGLVETYLSPVLRSWEYGRFDSTVSKLHLFGSDVTAIKKIKSPVVNLDAVVGLDVSCSLETTTSTGSSYEISPVAIESWFSTLDLESASKEVASIELGKGSRASDRSRAFRMCLARAVYLLSASGFAEGDVKLILESALAPPL